MRLVPEKFRGEGLFVFCNKCERQLGSNSKLCDCKNTDRWVYKIVLYVPKTGGKKKTSSTCKSRNLTGALQELFTIKSQLRTKIILPTIKKERTLAEGVKLFLQRVHREGEFEDDEKFVYGHEQDCVRYINRFLKSIVLSGRDPNRMLMSDLDDRLIAPYKKHIKKYAKKQSSKSNHIRVMRCFFNFIIDRGMYNGANFFRTVPTKAVTSNPIAVTDEEYDKFLNVITQENSIGTKGSNRKKYYYREWLKELFELARLTGLRKEELYELKFSDIKTYRKGIKLLLVHNYKVEKKTKKILIKVLPVTKNLESLITHLGNGKSEDDKIIESGYTKGHFSDFISRAFTHYYKIAHPDEEHKLFKQLRKAQITDIMALLGEDAYKITDHSGNAVLDKHYADKIELAIKMIELEQEKLKDTED